MPDKQADVWRYAIAALLALAFGANQSGVLVSLGDVLGGQVQPVPSDAPNMLDVFRTHADPKQAKSHAHLASGLFRALAEGLEFDATGPGKVKTGEHADLLRQYQRVYFARGFRFDEHYPRFGEVVAAFLKLRVGDSGGALEPDRRARWVSAYRDLAAACSNAQRGL